MRLFTERLVDSSIFFYIHRILIRNQQSGYPLDVIEHVKKIFTAMVTGLFSTARRVSLGAERYPSTG